jgi:hypothetical protein
VEGWWWSVRHHPPTPGLNQAHGWQVCIKYTHHTTPSTSVFTRLMASSTFIFTLPFNSTGVSGAGVVATSAAVVVGGAVDASSAGGACLGGSTIRRTRTAAVEDGMPNVDRRRTLMGAVRAIVIWSTKRGGGRQHKNDSQKVSVVVAYMRNHRIQQAPWTPQDGAFATPPFLRWGA